jgi:hypothetical protein
VFNMRRSPFDFNFYLLCVKNSLVDNCTSFNQKNPSYLVLTCHDFRPLVISDDLNGREADCVYLQAQNFKVVLGLREINLTRTLIDISFYMMHLYRLKK